MTRAKIRYSFEVSLTGIKIPGYPEYLKRYTGPDVEKIIDEITSLVNRERWRLLSLGWRGLLADWKAIQSAVQKLQGKRYSVPCAKPWVMYVVKIRDDVAVLLQYYKARGLPLEARWALVKFPLEAEVDAFAGVKR